MPQDDFRIFLSAVTSELGRTQADFDSALNSIVEEARETPS
jgi:hypothetical protein